MFFIAAKDANWSGRNGSLHFVALSQPEIRKLLPVVQAEMIKLEIAGQLIHPIELADLELERKQVLIDLVGATSLGEFSLATPNPAYIGFIREMRGSHTFSQLVASDGATTTVCTACLAVGEVYAVRFTPDGVSFAPGDCKGKTIAVTA